MIRKMSPILKLKRKCQTSFFLLLKSGVFVSVLIFLGTGNASASASTETYVPEQISLTIGRSSVIESPVSVKRISIVNPEIADAISLSPKQIYLTGKKPGVTTLTIWVGDKVDAVYDITVEPDTSGLKEKLHKILPEEKNIHVTATYEGIALSGTVTSASSLAQVIALAEAYAPGKVINLLEVAGVQQVMLEVRVAEISRDLSRRLGFNFNYISSSGRNIGLSLLNNLTSLPADGWPANPLDVSPAVDGIFSFVSNETSWTVFIDALKERGLVKVLAEPNLIALSGQTANFLAGGEFPIPVPQELGRTTIDYKQFGVGLQFTPLVLSSGKINMKVAPEVSELDFTNAVSFGGFVIPGITTRRVSTMIELGDGQSFAIAGLLKNNVREIVSKFPIFGDIPVLGALFRSSSFQKNETELIVIVTPHLVKPLDMAKQTLPTDQYIEPNDLEFYLLGNTEGKEKGNIKDSTPPADSTGGGFEGKFGLIIPD
jgi:pilus assembly protein CpaC